MHVVAIVRNISQRILHIDSMGVDHSLVITNYTNDGTIANGSCCRRHISTCSSQLVIVPLAEALCEEQTKTQVIIRKCSS